MQTHHRIYSEEKTMKGMIWHPEEKDTKVNEYLEKTNHAPYAMIAGLLLGIFCVFTLVVLFGMV